MPRTAAPPRRAARKNGRSPGASNAARNGGINYAESDDSDIGTVSDYQESDDDSRCSTPESQKNTVCSVCSRHVSSSDKSLQCDKCNEWCHIRCGGVTKEHYKQMVKLDESNIPIQWFCPPCDRLENPEKYSGKGANDTSSTISSNNTPTGKTQSGKGSNNSTPTSGNKEVVLPRTPSSLTVTPAFPTSAVNTKKTNSMPPTVTGKMPVGGTNSINGNNRLVFPDVKVRDLPFFPIKAMLLRPCLLNPKDKSLEMQQQNLAFYLSPEQANIVNSGRKVESNGMVVYKMHILLRFTKKSADSVHDDDFPKNLCLKVNNKVCPLPNPKPVPANRPNMEAKRPPKPLIITSLCKLNTKSCLNQMSISWTSVPDVVHAVSVYLVEKLTPVDLLSLLKSRGQRDPEITKTLIKSKLEDKEQDEIATTSCKVSMACPLGMARMNYPARSSTCDHLQCFDADTYLRMNEKKPKWVCPVCNKPAYFEHLFLDGFYIQLLQSQKFRSCGTNDIVLNQDASWEAVITEGVGVSDDSEDEDPLAIHRPPPGQQPPSARGSIPGTDLDVITIAPESDPVSQLAKLPIASAANLAARSLPSHSGHSTTVGHNFQSEDFFNEGNLSTEDNFMDWNYSVKFFSFIREDPKISSPASQSDEVTLVESASVPTVLTSADLQQNSHRRTGSPPMIQTKARNSSGSASAAQSPATETAPDAAGKKTRGGGGRGGRGRGARGGGGRGRGAAAKRSLPRDDDKDLDSAGSGDDDRPASLKRKAPQARGRGARGGAANRSRGGGRASGGGGAAAKKRTRYIESSDEESSESESEVMSRTVVTKSGRPSRNCRQSTNYAEIENTGDVLDYLLENR